MDQSRVYYMQDTIEGADPTTFVLLDEKGFYCKDQHRVYYNGKPITAEVATFILLEEYYSKDAQSAFYMGQLIEGVDVKSFEVLKNHHAKDNHQVYFRGKTIQGADASTFKLMKDDRGFWIGQDQFQQYEFGKPLSK